MSRVFFVGSRLSSAGLKSFLAGSDFSPIAETRTLAEAYRALCETLAENEPQILLIDVQSRLSDEEEESLRAIHRDRPMIKIAVISDALSLGLLSQQCPIEIDGYLLIEMLDVALKYSLHLIVSGQRISPPACRPAAPGSLPGSRASVWVQLKSHLSARELLVLQLLISGSANKVIARDLAISDGTVKVHVKTLLRKLSVQNRTQAALWGIEHGVPNLAAPA
jgi:two-component system, NarL family, nitrate/nitrite response regulator NarL